MGGGTRNKQKILVIDDEHTVRETVSMMLADYGYEVELAGDGNLGLRKIEAFQPDLVITDIIMPEREGVETILEIRRRWPRLPVIAISGGGRTSNMDFLEVARRFGASETLAKPFTIEVLAAAVARVLETEMGR